jgi:hypothetical protein
MFEPKNRDRGKSPSLHIQRVEFVHHGYLKGIVEVLSVVSVVNHPDGIIIRVERPVVEPKQPAAKAAPKKAARRKRRRSRTA